MIFFKYLIPAVILGGLAVGLFFVYLPGRSIEVENEIEPTPTQKSKSVFVSDIGPQAELPDPPRIIKAVYLTSWSGGSEIKIQQIINLAQAGKINAVVIDIKDFSGEIFRFPRPNALIKRLHDENIYIIARLAVFQDQVLVQARPELAVKSIKLTQSATASDDPEAKLSASYGAGIWRDRKGLAWIDPAASESWDYNIKIAKDAWDRGFDEINFDYIRFPTDGDLDDRLFPVWDGKKLMSSVMKDFYKKIRGELPDARLSIDLFGLAATSYYDFGVGQMIEDAFEYFDFVSPMLYPSHFPETFLDPPGGEIRKPAEYPYEVVRRSMDTAIARLNIYGKGKTALRPWLQDFDIGADYDAEKVRTQIQAVIDAAGGEGSEQYRGFMLWNPANIYTEEAL